MRDLFTHRQVRDAIVQFSWRSSASQRTFASKAELAGAAWLPDRVGGSQQAISQFTDPAWRRRSRRRQRRRWHWRPIVTTTSHQPVTAHCTSTSPPLRLTRRRCWVPCRTCKFRWLLFFLPVRSICCDLCLQNCCVSGLSYVWMTPAFSLLSRVVLVEDQAGVIIIITIITILLKVFWEEGRVAALSP